MTIFYNSFTKNTLEGNIATSISDHLTQFPIVTNKKVFPKKNGLKNYSKDKFLIDLKQINWNNYSKTNQNDPHQSFELFFQKLDQLFDKHCPKRKIIKKGQKSLPKPWITRGTLKSIKVKNKTYKQFFKSSDPLKKNEFCNEFKTYRNSIVKLTCQCKEDYLKSYFENNKKNSKKYDLINIKKSQ